VHAPAADILIVCTANEARSPLFAAFLDAALREHLGDGRISVDSAGLEARQGARAADGARHVAAARGVSLDDHVAVALRFTDTSRCALVVVMTRRQRRLVRRQAQTPPSRVFTLRELVDSLERSTLEHEPGERPRETLERIVEHAHRQRPRTLGRRWDVPDPRGGSLAVYEELAGECSAAAHLVADVLADTSGRPPAASAPG
jgi:protein-tyrosine-phosphatase